MYYKNKNNNKYTYNMKLIYRNYKNIYKKNMPLYVFTTCLYR